MTDYFINLVECIDIMEVVAHAAFLGTLVGTRLISAGKGFAWWIRVLSDLLFLIYGLVTDQDAFIYWTCVILYMDVSAAVRATICKNKTESEP